MSCSLFSGLYLVSRKKKKERKKKGRVREWRLEKKEEIKGKEDGERETGGVEGGVKYIL